MLSPLDYPEYEKHVLEFLRRQAVSYKQDITLVCMSNLMPDSHVGHLVCGLGGIVEWGWGG